MIISKIYLRFPRVNCVVCQSASVSRYDASNSTYKNYENCGRVPKYDRVTTFEKVIFPPNGEYKLPTMPAEPFYDASRGEVKHTENRRSIEARGVENIHTELIHRQYGLAAITGGHIDAKDFAFIQTRINQNLQEKQFAIWRVDAPWLPRTKKPQGTKQGGGRGPIHKYLTPVKAKRIILELGGHINEIEAYAYLSYIHLQFTFPVEVVSQELLDARRALETEIREKNSNKFDWEKVIKYNMQECHDWMSPYDIIWKGKYK